MAGGVPVAPGEAAKSLAPLWSQAFSRLAENAGGLPRPYGVNCHCNPRTAMLILGGDKK